jgi:hypothetical protein
MAFKRVFGPQERCGSEFYGPSSKKVSIEPTGRRFEVQLAVQQTSKQHNKNFHLFSKVVEEVDRTVTDISFPDDFVIHDQDPDFCLSLVVYCRRTDEGPPGIGGLSRSLGKSIGNSVKSQLASAGATISGVAGSRRRRLLRESVNTDSSGREKHKPMSTEINEWAENLKNPGRMIAVATASLRLQNVSLSGRWSVYFSIYSHS